MAKTKTDLQKVIDEADKLIASAETAKTKRQDALKELRAQQQKEHLSRLYDIGRVVFELGLSHLDDALIAGILLRGRETIAEEETREPQLRAKGKKALSAVRNKVDLEVLIMDRPNRSTAAILRQAGLTRGESINRGGKRWTQYVGKASRAYLQSRLQDDAKITINLMTS